MIEWRPYQTEVIDAVFNDWQKYKSVLVVGATGMGKTQVFWGIVDRYLGEHPNARICVFAHRKELIDQPKERVEKFFPHLAMRVGVVMADTNEAQKQILIATAQTIGQKSGKRIAEILRYGQIDLLIADECHHLASAGQRRIVDTLRAANPTMKLLGVTATPERADKKNLTEIFEAESANIGIVRLIEEGWLCKPVFHGVKTNVDLSSVSVQGSGGNRDYNQQQLVDAVETQDCFRLVVKTHMEFAKHRPTIIFTPSVAGAYKLAELLSNEGIRAIAADGTTDRKEREGILEGMKTGLYTTVVNCALFTEGLDAPNLEVAHLVRPTKSDPLWIQMIGRVLRIAPGKEQADIFDYQPKDYRNFNMRLKMFQPKKKIMVERNGTGEGLGGTPKPKAGDRVEYEILDYISKRRESWSDCNGWQIVGLGKGADEIERSLAVSPDGAQLWAVWRKAGEFKHQAKAVVTGDFEAVKGKTEEFLQKYGGRHVDKKAPWRKQQPTEKQIEFGKKLRVWRDGLNAGALSDAINQTLVMRAIRYSSI